ncbi:MAG: hypothetical protein HYU24_08370 [Candidatus Rokubacteria bacterium]|nr:hypothetical protein [Candidatus Rokubacteria bacterium]
MAEQGLKDLVGRAMIDPDFLQALMRDPYPLLADYELSEEERASVLQAIAKLMVTPQSQRARAFQTAVVKRWAT